jgi:hypothetical protein
MLSLGHRRAACVNVILVALHGPDVVCVYANGCRDDTAKEKGLYHAILRLRCHSIASLQ